MGIKTINADAKRRKVKKLVSVQSRRNFRCEVCGTRLVIFKRDPGILICPKDGFEMESKKAMAADAILTDREEKLVDMNASKPIIMSIKSTAKRFTSLGRSTADDLELPSGATLIDDF